MAVLKKDRLKRIYIGCIIGALCILFVGCNNQKDTSLVFSTPGEKPTADSVALPGYGIVCREFSYSSVEERLRDSDDVILGEVKEIQYSVDNGDISTRETVLVLDSMYGELKKGDIITVVKSCGYVLMQMYIDSYDNPVERIETRYCPLFKDYTDEELKTEYIAQMTLEDYDLDIGDKSVLFLTSTGEQDLEYRRVGGNEGEYLLLENGNYQIPGRQMDDADKENLPDDYQTEASYEELLHEINAANVR